MSLTVGQTVGPYQVTARLGQGGMATVYQAYHPNLDRFVAIKVLHPAFKEDPNFLVRFQREAQIIAKLDHPNIVPIYDYADVAGQPYLVMKFIEGQTLKQRMRQGPLSLEEVLHLLEATASALTYAHTQGILHRDIKPSNIMLGNDDTPYITDFGLARLVQAGESTMSQDMMLGTPQYISPEQAKGIRDLGPAADIYSLGVVIYEMLVGRVPFNADTPYTIVHDHIYKPLPLPTDINPDVPAQVEQVLLRALAKEPGARFASAVDMVDALKHAIEDAAPPALTISYALPHQETQASFNPATPIPAPSPTPHPPVSTTGMMAEGFASSIGSHQYARASRRRSQLWILSGVGALLLVCLASLFIIVRAVSDPAANPWNVDEDSGASQPSPPHHMEMGDRLPTLSLEEAQAFVDANPQDPVAYLALAMAAANQSERDLTFTALGKASDLIDDISNQTLAEIAAQLSDESHPEIALWLYLEILSRDELSPDLRDEAGSYLYNAIRANPVPSRTITTLFITRPTTTPLAEVFHAWAILQAEQRLLAQRQAMNFLSDAIQEDNTLAEAYLVRGIAYESMGDLDLALEDWSHAAELPDAPDWVRLEATELQQQHP